VKFLSSQLAYLVGNRDARANFRAFLKYVATLAALITLYAVVFHVIKIRSGTGMSVVALDHGGALVTQLTRETPLERGAVLLLLGSLEQRRKFAELFEKTA